MKSDSPIDVHVILEFLPKFKGGEVRDDLLMNRKRLVFLINIALLHLLSLEGMVTESNESTAHGRKRKPDAANGNKGANDILDFYYYFTKEKNFSLIC